MSILLTGSEIEALEIKHKPQNGPGSFMAYSRAIQLALIEKLRKKPVAFMSSRNGFICKENKNHEYNKELVCLPTPQELENES